MSLSTDYIGRVVDIDIFGINTDEVVQDATLSFGAGNVIAGSYKEAQKFVRILLSDTDSLQAQPTYGGGLFKRLNQGTISNRAQFEIFFTQAKARTLSFMRMAKAKGGSRDPRFLEDEALKDVAIRSIHITPGSFKLVLKFTFVDPDADIIIPVGISVGT